VSPADDLRARWRQARVPPGLPPLPSPLQLAVVLLDGDDPGFAANVGTDWCIELTELDADVVHDGAVAAPLELAEAICGGALDPGHAVAAGAVTGTMASQSVLAYLLEVVALADHHSALGDGS